MYGYGFLQGLVGTLYMLVPILILGVIIYLAVKAAMGKGVALERTLPGKRPVEIAEERYAKGEITFSELEEIRKNLMRS